MLQPYQNLVSSGVSSPYRSKSSYRHSCAPSYIPFTFDSCTVSHSLSLLPAAIGVRLGQAHPTRYLPVPPLTAMRSSYSSLFSVLSCRWRGLPSWTPPDPEICDEPYLLMSFHGVVFHISVIHANLHILYWWLLHCLLWWRLFPHIIGLTCFHPWLRYGTWHNNPS